MRKSLSQVLVHRIMLAAVLIGLGAVPVLLLGGGPVLLLVTTELIRSAFERPPHLSERELERAVEELRGQGFQPGLHLDVQLPPRFRPMTETGTVNLIATADGRTIVLFKTSIGWKGNYRGIVFSDAPLKSEEVVSGTGRDSRSSILIDHFQTFIRKRISDRQYEVFFDLG